MKRRTKADDEVEAFLYPEAVTWRPRKRGDCANVPRPCPYVGCRHNNYLEVSQGGQGEDSPMVSLKIAEMEPWDFPPELSCTLDMAELGSRTYDGVGLALGVTRERARQLINWAWAKFERLAGKPLLRALREQLALREALDGDDLTIYR